MLAAMPALLLVFYVFKARVMTWYFYEVFPAACMVMAALLVRTLARGRVQGAIRRRSVWLWRPLPAPLLAAGTLAMLCLAVPLTLLREHGYTHAYNLMDNAVANVLGRDSKAILVLDPAIPERPGRELLCRNDPDLKNPRIYLAAKAVQDLEALGAIARKAGASSVYRLSSPATLEPKVSLMPIRVPDGLQMAAPVISGGTGPT
jgi:hypothetical protein